MSRKTFLINPRFQFTCIGYMTVISAVAIIVLYLSSFYFFWKFQKLGADLGIPNNNVFFLFIEKQKVIMNEITLITSVLLMIAILIIGIIFSHRISGPIHRLEEHIKKIARGAEPQNVRFREKDYFPELAEAFNQMIDQLKKAQDDIPTDKKDKKKT